MSGMSVKELGETEDPKELVPGEPGQVRTAATAFGDEGRHMNRVHSTLSGLSAPAWEGRAADAFNAEYPQAIKPWTEIADELGKVETAIDAHAGVLSSAQDKAQQAIDKYKEGERKTQTAIAQHDAAVADYNAAATRPVPTIGGAPGGGRPSPPGAFVDPGVGLREEAQELLAQAREQVSTSVTSTRDAMIKLPGALTSNGPAPGDGDPEHEITSNPATFAEGEHNRHEREGTFGDESLTEGDPGEGVNANMELAGVGAEGSFFGSEVSATDQYGALTASGSAGWSAFGGEANASVGTDGRNLTAEAGAGVHAIRGEASGSLEAGPASLEGTVEGEVGANASVNASIGADGVHAGGEAFAGARAEASGTVEVGGVGATGTAEAWAGAGVEADIGVGMNDDGSFTIGGEFGAALGVGGKVGGEITIDPGEVVDTAEDVAEGIGDGVEAAGDALGDAASGIGDALGF